MLSEPFAVFAQDMRGSTFGVEYFMDFIPVFRGLSFRLESKFENFILSNQRDVATCHTSI